MPLGLTIPNRIIEEVEILCRHHTLDQILKDSRFATYADELQLVPNKIIRARIRYDMLCHTPCTSVNQMKIAMEMEEKLIDILNNNLET